MAISMHASEIDTYINVDNDNETTKKVNLERGTDANGNLYHYSNGDQFLSQTMKVEMVNEQAAYKSLSGCIIARAHTHTRGPTAAPTTIRTNSFCFF